jgi:hypothetical protein
MTHTPEEFLKKGCTILDAVLVPRGFNFEFAGAGKGSGGHFATGSYANGERRIELHFRFSLGLVAYHFGSVSIGHKAYMGAILGSGGGNKFPGFSDGPLAGFRGLAYDLETYAKAFLAGDMAEFVRSVELAQKAEALPGFARLVKSEG